jgi:katanin p60 ATPase-containing subunit A1
LVNISLREEKLAADFDL